MFQSFKKKTSGVSLINDFSLHFHAPAKKKQQLPI